MPARDLTEFIEDVTGGSHLRVEDDLGDGFVVLRVSEAERRQARHDVRCTEDIVIEMLRNSRDAHARNIFVATTREGSLRKLTVLDDGDGIPQHLKERIFDARVTSKLDTAHVDTWGVHGRGMALYAVRLNSSAAHVAASKVGGGTSIVVEIDTSELAEKADQSSMPRFLETEAGTVVVRGTRNINRTVCEFSYVTEGCTVYLGSPVEIASTLWEFGTLLVPASTRAFTQDVSEIDVCKRLAFAFSPDQFVEIAHSIGLDLSSRSARRIMDGELEPSRPVSEIVSVQSDQDAKSGGERRKRGSKVRDLRGLHLMRQDKEALARAAKDAFASIAEGYYLEPDVNVSISVRGDSIRIAIPIEKIR